MPDYITLLHEDAREKERGSNSLHWKVLRVFLIRVPLHNISAANRSLHATRRRMKSETAQSQSTFATSFIWCHLGFVWRRRRTGGGGDLKGIRSQTFQWMRGDGCAPITCVQRCEHNVDSFEQASVDKKTFGLVSSSQSFQRTPWEDMNYLKTVLKKFGVSVVSEDLGRY